MNGRMPNVYGEFIASFCFQSINIKELCKESVNPLVIQSTLSQGEEYINTRDLFAQNPSNPGITWSNHQGTQQSPFSFTLSLFPLGSYLYANAEEKKKTLRATFWGCIQGGYEAIHFIFLCHKGNQPPYVLVNSLLSPVILPPAGNFQ